jgi:hypothetical protein
MQVIAAIGKRPLLCDDGVRNPEQSPGENPTVHVPEPHTMDVDDGDTDYETEAGAEIVLSVCD